MPFIASIYYQKKPGPKPPKPPQPPKPKPNNKSIQIQLKAPFPKPPQLPNPPQFPKLLQQQEFPQHLFLHLQQHLDIVNQLLFFRLVYTIPKN